jgi:MOSC domain-containing protein YiiM
MSGRVEALWLKPEKYGPMRPVDRLDVVERTGIKDNADWGGRRQITIIEKERWAAMMDALDGADVDPSARRANVMVSGCDLNDSRNHILQLGDVRVEIVGETRPCERMDQAHQGLRRAMAEPWNGGAYGVILDGGAIRVGDAASLRDAPSD